MPKELKRKGLSDSAILSLMADLQKALGSFHRCWFIRNGQTQQQPWGDIKRPTIKMPNASWGEVNVKGSAQVVQSTKGEPD